MGHVEKQQNLAEAHSAAEHHWHPKTPRSQMHGLVLLVPPTGSEVASYGRVVVCTFLDYRGARELPRVKAWVESVWNREMYNSGARKQVLLRGQRLYCLPKPMTAHRRCRSSSPYIACPSLP